MFNVYGEEFNCAEPPPPFGPKHPNLGIEVERFRRAARIAPLEPWEKQLYGEAVGIAIRKLQRTELMRVLTPTPTSNRSAISRTPSPLWVKYVTPNPFPMVGDPPETKAEIKASEWEAPRLKEQRLYQYAMESK